jgi:hypothetical protein
MLRRYRGVIAIVVVAVAVIAWALAKDPISRDATATTTTVIAAGDLASMSLPKGVIPWDKAAADGTTSHYDWGARCDSTKGTLAMPYVSPGPCFVPFKGHNGGATSTGVTAEEIKVVVYEANQSDPLAAMASAVAGGFSDPKVVRTVRDGFAAIYSKYYETYGRRVDLVPFPGTGMSNDAVAAVADAETIARDIRPFMVIGGPALTNAFADTLASRGVICIQCTPGQPNAFYVHHAPYVWDLLMNPEQNGLMVNEYIGQRLARRPAKWAGDPAMHDRTRVFGSVHIALGPDTAALTGILSRDLARYGVRFAVDASFPDPSSLTATARDIITQLKQAGVTTVVYTGDPLAPATLTKVATQQDYFPEWVITGTALIDTDVLARTYDQRQWAHAFGPADLFVRSSSGANASADLWKWYFGTEPPLQGSALSGLIGTLQILFIVLQLMGPDVTPANFQQTLFTAPTIPGTPQLGQISFGTRLWPQPDYSALDDQAEVWWDPNATGVDELGSTGKGMWQWVNGGARVLPGHWPRTAPDVFDPSNAVSMLDTPPPAPTTYEPVH